MIRVVFLGTPQEAVPSLEALTTVADVRLVVTREDRPRGRSGRPQPSPVKVAALAAGLPVAQPAKSSDLAALLRSEGPDVGVVVAFGMILPSEALAVPPRGLVNLHFSLLPRWRGASPVAAALLAGDDRTGVTLIQMTEGVDEGPVLASAPLAVPESADRGWLSAELARLAGELLVDSWDPLLTGGLTPIDQDEARATYAPKLSDSDRRLRFEESPGAFVNRVRAFGPRPGAYITIRGARYKILQVRLVEGRLAPGSLEIGPGGELLCGTGGGAVEVLTIQPPGRRPMTAGDWLRGLRGLPGPADLD